MRKSRVRDICRAMRRARVAVVGDIMLDRYIWGFVGGRPVRTGLRTFAAMPARTPLSDAISADLKARGFKFVGSTVVYSHMQATGMVNDHLAGCFRNREIGRRSKAPIASRGAAAGRKKRP